MQFVRDNSFILWREEITKWLEDRGDTALDPTLKERDTRKDIILDVKKEENIDLLRSMLRKEVISPDIQMVFDSDALIAYIDREKVYGTVAELFLGYFLDKPCLVVYSIPREKWSGWIIGLSTQIFTSLEGLKEYIIEYY